MQFTDPMTFTTWWCGRQRPIPTYRDPHLPCEGRQRRTAVPWGLHAASPPDEWYRDILSKMDDGKVAVCIENAISSQIDRLRKMGRIPADGMTIAIDAHLIPCYCQDHGSEMIHSRSKQETDYFIRYVTAAVRGQGRPPHACRYTHARA